MKGRKSIKSEPASARLASGSGRNLQPIVLLKPEKDGGKSVLAALWKRKTTRAVRSKRLSPQVLSNLLWAAFGVNRKRGPFGGPGRTAASASSSQEIDVYVFLPEGVYLYEATFHRLAAVRTGDLRGILVGFGNDEYVMKAPVNLLYVSDLSRYGRAPFMEPGLLDREVQKSYSNIAVGLIAGNVYLYAASQGLAAWLHNCRREKVADELNLKPEQRVLYVQTVGYPVS